MALADLSPYSILLVDDVTFSRQTIFKMLKDMGNPTIHLAEDGDEALQVLHKNPDVDFVVSDFKMPNFNGLQLLKAIRTGKTDIKRGIPFAMLTGYSDRHLVDMALALDINAFLTKPVSKKSLADRLGKMLAPDDGKSALKPADAYEDVVVEEREDVAAVEEEDVAAVEEDVAVVKTGEEKPPAMKKNGGGIRARRPGIVLRNEIETRKVVGRMSSLKGKFQECDLVTNITMGVDRLVTDAGSSQATHVVSFIDGLVSKGILELEDVPDVLDFRDADQEGPDDATRSRKAKAFAETAGGKAGEFYYRLTEIPLGAILAHDIFSKDGSLLIKKGIPLTQQVVSILAHLHKIGALKLTPGGEIAVSAPESEPYGVFANFSPVPGETDPEPAYASESPPSEGFTRTMQGDYAWEMAVPAHEIPEGAILARDIYTADGQIYMHAGNILSAKIISLLKDLQDLGNLTSNFWITT